MSFINTIMYFWGRHLIVLTIELLLREEHMLKTSALAHAFNITYLRCYWCLSRPWGDWSESILEYHYSFLPEYSQGAIVHSCPGGSNWLFKYEVHKNILSGCFCLLISCTLCAFLSCNLCSAVLSPCCVVDTVSPGTGRDLKRVLQSIY